MKVMCCIASGPSLTKEDCDLIEASGIPTIAVNNSWEMARFSKYIYAGDHKWWKEHIGRIDIDAQKWTCTKRAAREFKVNLHKLSGSYNSGMRAIQFAIMKGAEKIILLGFDCSLANGVHWHGPHEKLANPRPNSPLKWKKEFQKAADEAKRKKVKVYNCSRNTSLKCFKRANLAEVLNGENAKNIS